MPLGMLGKYEKLDVLGHGASGIVYLAKDTLLNRQVALKVVDLQAGDIAHFIEEARVLDRLRHPNIVRVHNIDRIEGNIVLDMEYVRGKNLQETLRERGPFPIEEAVDLAIKVLDALEYAHQMQTVHRDIKPANILIGKQGEIKLVDFGLAEILATNSYAGGAGTYAYMAPEDFAEEEHSDHQSDIWAAGVTLYEILTGHKPFQSPKARDPFAWKRILENELPSPLLLHLRDAPVALQTILNRALAKEKSRRYQSAAEFRDDLQTLLVALQNKTQSTTHLNGNQVAQTASRSNLLNVLTKPASVKQVGHASNGTVRSVPKQMQLQKAGTLSAPQNTTLQRPARQRQALAGVATANPSQAIFGKIAPGERKTLRLNLLVNEAVGDVSGSLTFAPDWIEVHPPAFSSAHQQFTMTAIVPDGVAEGSYADSIRFLIDGEELSIPVAMKVLKPQPGFGRVALWFLPMIVVAILPALTVGLVAVGVHPIPHGTAEILPSGFAASGVLAVMLLLISLAANVGWFARILCGLEVLGMGSVMGAMYSRWEPGVFNVGALRAALVCFVLAVPIIFQILSLRWWKLWSVVMFGLSLSVTAYLCQQLHLINIIELIRKTTGN